MFYGQFNATFIWLCNPVIRKNNLTKRKYKLSSAQKKYILYKESKKIAHPWSLIWIFYLCNVLSER